MFFTIFQVLAVASLAVIILCSGSTTNLTEPTSTDRHSYLVRLHNLNDSASLCEGVLISPIMVLTAASCFDSIPRPYHGKHLVLGTERNVFRKERFTVKVSILRTQFMDLAVIKLSADITDKVIQPIAMCKKNCDTDNRTLYTLGWRDVTPPEGSTLSYAFKLHKINVTQTSCKNIYADYAGEDIICTSLPKVYESCHDPAGGPLVSNGQLVGVRIDGCQGGKHQASFNDICALRSYVEGVMRSMIQIPDDNFDGE